MPNPKPKQPQDRKPKAKKPELFEFTGADGKEYTLPPAADGSKNLTGWDLRQAALGGEPGQVEYMIKTLEATGAPEATLGALYALPQPEFVEIMFAWGEHDNGAPLGESSP